MRGLPVLVIAGIAFASNWFVPNPAYSETLDELIRSGSYPVLPSKSLSSSILLDRVKDGEWESIVFLNRRAPGTRAPIHMHDSGGISCVLEGEETLIMENQKPLRVAAPGCYYMPNGIRMFAYNSGRTDNVTYDIFKGSIGFAYWRVDEKTAGVEILNQFGTQDSSSHSH